MTGKLPKNASIQAKEVTDVDPDAIDVLFAVDISIYEEDGTLFEPDKDALSVTITSDEISSENGIYYITDDASEVERMDSECKDGEASFDAEHFSIYAVTDSDTIIASGTIDNAEGDADAITWTIYEDDAGERYFLVEGNGSMPDYTAATEQPWYSYRNTAATIVFDEGITRVGTFCFSGWLIHEIKFSSTIESIGKKSFSYSQKLTSITIPGTCKTVESDAFVYSYTLASVTIEDGVETIGSNAFGSQTGNINTIYIPASVTSIGSSPFWFASEYIVSEDNEYYCSIDGVLYSKDKTQLVDYPRRKEADSYTVPGYVEEVLEGALMCTKTDKLYITENTDIKIHSNSIRSSKYTSIYIADGVNVSEGLFFYNMSELTTIRLPENTPLAIGAQYFSLDGQLSSLKIPNGTTSIDKLSLSGTTNLESLYYDAANATINIQLFGTATMPLFDLTIGENVEYLPENFYAILDHANSVSLVGENTFYIEEGAFDNAPAPYEGLSGWVYVDEYGGVYTLDTENHTATLYAAPTDVKEYTVLSSIAVGDDREDAKGTYAVTTVAPHALKYSELLATLSFEDASVITSLESYALANAPITSITDLSSGVTATTETDAESLFGNATIGYRAFYDTNLEDAETDSASAATMDGVWQALSIGEGTGMTIDIKSGDTTEWNYTDETKGIGGYTSLTGDTASFMVSVSNTTGSSQVYRLYLTKTGDDCSLDCGSVGETKTINGVTYAVCGTDDPYTVYLEFEIAEGNTVSFTVGAVYPSPTSSGGGVTAWGAIVEEEDGEPVEVETTDTVQAWWETAPDTYTLSKENLSNQSSISIVADDDGVIRPSNSLNYKITLDSTGETSTYGKDYVTTATYTDVLTLPDGMAWDEEVLTAIKEGNVTRSSNVLYVNGVSIASISLSSTTGLSLSSFSISYDEDKDQVILKWKVRNSSDYNMNTNTLTFKIMAEALTVDPDTYDFDATNTIDNTATVKISYTHSGSKEETSNATKTVTGGAGTIKIQKTKLDDVSYFGEDISYSIKVYNDGALPYEGADGRAYTITDSLIDTLCIGADSMEQMFMEAAEDGASLVITISGAKLGTGSYVTDTDGEEETISVNTGNSDLSDETSDHTLVITYDPDGSPGKYTITVDGDTDDTVVGDDLERLLESLGYGITRSATYTCDWTLPMTGSGEDAVFVLNGGQNHTYKVYATVKNTFQILDDSDWPNQYPKTSTLTISNSAKLNYKNESGQNKSLTSNASTDSVQREAVISKSVAMDGKTLSSKPKAYDGDVLDYTLKFQHYGDGEYENLPMVDDIYGSQYLLVPVEENKDNESIQKLLYEKDSNPEGTVTIFTDEDGTEYYKLGKGSYTDVKVGLSDGTLMTAASITVTTGNGESASTGDDSYTWSGVHTQIKWYFDDLSGGKYNIEVTYKVVVDTNGNEDNWTIGNIVWMNDRTGSRIYDGLWGGGTIIGFDKDIVVGDDETNISKVDEVNNETQGEGSDALDDDKYCTISEGESVTYRLVLNSTGDENTSFTLASKDLADQLPNTYGSFAWSAANVTIDRVEVSGKAEGTDDLKDKWSIETEYNGITGEGIYFILWDDDVSVKFYGNTDVYIYVTLTFPTDDADLTWSDYLNNARGTTLENTLYVYRNPMNVTHVLAEEGSARLQKGVYALMRATADVTANSSRYYLTGSSRDYYNNQDGNYRYVAYYAELYNGGHTKLYLNDLYDDLPDGFQYVTMINSNTQSLTTYSFTVSYVATTENSSGTKANRLVEHEDGVTYLNATVTSSYDSGNNRITFKVSNGSGSDAIGYDEDRGQYYLDTDQAIVFGYICKIGTQSETKDASINTIGMSYTDYTNAGVEVDDQEIASTELSDQYEERNDGDCTVETADTVSTAYGLSDDSGNESWLISSVTLNRGSIKPGIIKETESYQVNESSTPVAYTTSVNYNYLVNWKTTIQNAGDSSMVNYKITDIMPSPFIFTGSVGYTLYAYDRTTLGEGTFFSFPDSADTRTLADGDTVTIHTGVSTTNTADVTVGGETVTITAATTSSGISYGLLSGKSQTYTLRLYLDDSGNLVMEIGVLDAALAIPEGGSMAVTYTSVNPTNEASNETYINQVTLTPSQTFEESDIQAGSAVTDEDENLTGIKSKSPVTVAVGYATDSYKTVTQKDDDANTASSKEDENVIVLPAADDIFTYTLHVENVNDKDITKMVLIDNLPETGDLYAYNNTIERNSAFTVTLADYAFSLSTTAEDGSVTDLTSDDFIVEWSDKVPTEDVSYSEDDRKGTSTWETLDENTDLSQVRAIRIIVTSNIPAKSTLSVSFDAKVDGEAEAGSIAWNNFGYGYQIGSSTWLEAMPTEVGVQVPSAPKLQKKLTTKTGEDYTASKDMDFTFVVYKGSEVTDSDGKTFSDKDKLIDALGSTEYKEVTVTVKAGESASGYVHLTGEGWEDWTWEKGETYTIIEFISEDNFEFTNWTSSDSKKDIETISHTFTYDRDSTLYLNCYNTSGSWILNVRKVDAEDNAILLENARFALYSKEKQSDVTVPSGIDETITVTDDDGNTSTWYYYMDGISDETGMISFTGLSDETYYLVETKAPSGYSLKSKPIEATRVADEQTLEIENQKGFAIPLLGSTGFWFLGFLGVGLILWYFKKRKPLPINLNKKQ